MVHGRFQGLVRLVLFLQWCHAVVCPFTGMTLALTVKSTGGKIPGIVTKCWAVAPNLPSRHGPPLFHTPPVSPSLMKLLKLLISLTLNPGVQVSLMSCVTAPGSIRKLLLLLHTNRERTGQHSCDVAGHFFDVNGIPFLYERMTGKKTTIIHSWVLGRYFLENKEVTLSLYAKQLADIGCQWWDLNIYAKIKILKILYLSLCNWQLHGT